MKPGPFHPRLRLEPADRADYARLAPHHYRAGPPATSVLLLRAVLDAADSPTHNDLLAGVLVVSMPTLNASWRTLAWPHLFRPGSPRAATARTVNTHLRTISRVIVDPRLRGLGIASTLVRAYLRRPLTRCTEAIAAMARVSPVFQSAGMREIPFPPTPADSALRKALRAHRLTPAAVLAGAPVPKRLDRALRTWAAASSGTRPFADLPRSQLARRAASRLLAPPLVFVTP